MTALEHSFLLEANTAIQSHVLWLYGVHAALLDTHPELAKRIKIDAENLARTVNRCMVEASGGSGGVVTAMEGIDG